MKKIFALTVAFLLFLAAANAQLTHTANGTIDVNATNLIK